MTSPEGLGLLRVPFDAIHIGKLPRVTCKACSDAPSRVCDRHTKGKCAVCDQWISSAHLHLDFVGHAALTDRFLDADPEWTWEPLALTPAGLPAFDDNGGLWIKLTLCGVTRLGYGDAQGKRGPNAVKEAIGDALRNAGMRFGAALDLWHKGDLHGDDNPALDPEHRQPPASREKAKRTKRVDPDSDPFAQPITDRVWWTDWQQTVAEAPNKTALDAAWRVLKAKVEAGEVEEQHAVDGKALLKARMDVLAPAPTGDEPASPDGGEGGTPAPPSGDWPDVAPVGGAA